MSPNGHRPLAADPYPHQPDSERKIKRVQHDVEVLGRVLGMSGDQVHADSAAFIGREDDLFRFVFAMRFLDFVNLHELKEGASTLRALSVIFAIEGIAPGNLPNRERLSRFLIRYLEPSEKLMLLNGYLFTPEYPLGGNSQPQRHLMFERAVGDAAFRKAYAYAEDPKFCSPGCFCVAWLQAQAAPVINEFIQQLAERLYKMRCAVVHDATPVAFGEAAGNKPADVDSWSATVIDAFSVRRGEYVMYETSLPVSQTVATLLGGIRRCFAHGARF